MNRYDAVFDSLDAFIRESKPGDWPALVVALAARVATLGACLAPDPAAPSPAPTPDVWLTPDQAAEIASVTRKRVYGWAKGKKWAARPTRKILRINERGYRAWLATR